MIDALKKLGVDVEKTLKVANMSSDFYKKARLADHRQIPVAAPFGGRSR